MIVRAIDSRTPAPWAIAEAAAVLRRGGVVAYPTDTLYGLATDPRSEDAVARLFAAKGRDEGQPIPLIAASMEQAAAAGRLGELERRLAAAFWPGPLTIVVPAQPGLSSRVRAGGATIAIRVPSHAVALALAEAFGFCITSTSANRSGEPAVSTGDGVAGSLQGAIDLLLDSGPIAGGLPSTIVAIESSGPRLVRAGAVPWDRVLESLE